jgi:uncharacterized protein YdaU (DUF1376 family)
MSKTPFMPLWNGDILADTLEMDATEFGAFLLLIIAQWQRKGESLPDDQKRLQRVARVGRAWPKVWNNIERYFDRDEKGVYSAKCRILHQNVALKTEVNSRNGARGGAAKALRAKETGLANAIKSPQRNAGISESYPEKIYNKDDDTQFSEFWDAFPKRTNMPSKDKVRAKFLVALKSVSFDDLMRAVRAYADHRAKAVAKDGDAAREFTKSADAWLNGKFWESWLSEPKTETAEDIRAHNEKIEKQIADALGGKQYWMK